MVSIRELPLESNYASISTFPNDKIWQKNAPKNEHVLRCLGNKICTMRPRNQNMQFTIQQNPAAMWYTDKISMDQNICTLEEIPINRNETFTVMPFKQTSQIRNGQGYIRNEIHPLIVGNENGNPNHFIPQNNVCPLHPTYANSPAGHFQNRTRALESIDKDWHLLAEDVKTAIEYSSDGNCRRVLQQQIWYLDDSDMKALLECINDGTYPLKPPKHIWYLRTAGRKPGLDYTENGVCAHTPQNETLYFGEHGVGCNRNIAYPLTSRPMTFRNHPRTNGLDPESEKSNAICRLMPDKPPQLRRPDLSNDLECTRNGTCPFVPQKQIWYSGDRDIGPLLASTGNITYPLKPQPMKTQKQLVSNGMDPETDCYKAKCQITSHNPWQLRGPRLTSELEYSKNGTCSLMTRKYKGQLKTNNLENELYHTINDAHPLTPYPMWELGKTDVKPELDCNTNETRLFMQQRKNWWPNRTYIKPVLDVSTHGECFLRQQQPDCQREAKDKEYLPKYTINKHSPINEQKRNGYFGNEVMNSSPKWKKHRPSSTAWGQHQYFDAKNTHQTFYDSNYNCTYKRGTQTHKQNFETMKSIQNGHHNSSKYQQHDWHHYATTRKPTEHNQMNHTYTLAPRKYNNKSPTNTEAACINNRNSPCTLKLQERNQSHDVAMRTNFNRKLSSAPRKTCQTNSNGNMNAACIECNNRYTSNGNTRLQYWEQDTAVPDDGQKRNKYVGVRPGKQIWFSADPVTDPARQCKINKFSKMLRKPNWQNQGMQTWHADECCQIVPRSKKPEKMIVSNKSTEMEVVLRCICY